MRAEVLAVGTELLLGDIVNSNAAWIGRALASIGIDCFGHATVGDNTERIAEAIGASLARADALIITGGLGPTQDDVTREAIALVTGRALERDAMIETRLRERFGALGREMAPSNLRQADVPAGATVIEQTFGTAPGLIVEHDACVIYAIPGVPAEMEDMMTRAVLPDLAHRAGLPERIVSRVVRIAGVAESSVADALAPLWDRLGGSVTMAFLAGGGEVRVRLTAKAADDASAARALDDAERGVRERLGAAVVGVDDETLGTVVLRLLRARGWSLATAESLTAGWIAGRIAEVPGASDVLRGGVVAYAAAVKRDALGVDESLLDQPVSERVARAMAEGARRVVGADVAVAATGVAGPESHGREPGVVCIAVAGPLGVVSREIRLPGDRNTVRTLAAGAAINLVRLYLLQEVAPRDSS
jgi:nicotinamide-nucleotide amidase